MTKDNSTEVFKDVPSFVITFAREISLRHLLKVLSDYKEVCENVICMYKQQTTKAKTMGRLEEGAEFLSMEK